jgi:anti-sigma B factor antagonist
MSLQPSIFADTESGPVVWIRVEGKGTFQNSPGLKEFSRQMMDRGRRDFVVDLANCPAMDSTFMGTLAGLALRLREVDNGHLWVVNRNDRKDNGHLWVVNRNDRNSELLEGLGLDALFAHDPTPAMHSTLNGNAVELTTDKATTREVMRAAHEACVAANPENAARFKDVLEHLRASAARG